MRKAEVVKKVFEEMAELGPKGDKSIRAYCDVTYDEVVSEVLEAVRKSKGHIDEFTDKKGLISGRFAKIAIDKEFKKFE